MKSNKIVPLSLVFVILSALSVSGLVNLEEEPEAEIGDVRSPSAQEVIDGLGLEFAGDTSKLYVGGSYVYTTSGNSVRIFGKTITPFGVPELLGSITDTSGLALNQANDIFVEEGVAYVGSGEGIQILDVSDPDRIRHISSYTVANGVLSMFFSDDRVYFSAYDNSGGYLEVLGASNPGRLSSLGVVEDNGSLYLNRTRDLVVKEGVVYLASDEGFQALNVSNPRNVNVLHSNNTCSFRRVAVGDESVYVSSNTSQECNLLGFGIEDFSLTYSESSDPIDEYSTIFVYNDLIYATSHEGLSIVNSEDFGGEFVGGYAYRDFVIKDDLLYVASNDGFSVLDSDLFYEGDSDNEILETLKENESSFRGGDTLEGRNFFFDNQVGLIYVLHHDRIKLWRDYNHRILGYLEPLARLDPFSDVIDGYLINVSSENFSDSMNRILVSAKNLFVRNNYAYLYSGSGIQILDISNPQRIRILGNFTDLVSDARRMKMVGDLGYVFNHSSLQILRINGSNISEVKNFTNFAGFTGEDWRVDADSRLSISDIKVTDDSVFVFNNRGTNSSAVIFNISDLNDITYSVYEDFLPTFGYGINSYSTIKDGLLYHYYIAGQRLTILNVSDPSNIAVLSKGVDLIDGREFVFIIEDMAVDGDYLYIVVSENGHDSALSVVNVSDPSNPSLVQYVRDEDEEFLLLDKAYSVFAENGIAYIASQEGIQTVEVVAYQFDGDTRLVGKIGRLLFGRGIVGDYFAGFRVLPLQIKDNLFYTLKPYTYEYWDHNFNSTNHGGNLPRYNYIANGLQVLRVHAAAGTEWWRPDRQNNSRANDRSSGRRSSSSGRRSSSSGGAGSILIQVNQSPPLNNSVNATLDEDNSSYVNVSADEDADDNESLPNQIEETKVLEEPEDDNESSSSSGVGITRAVVSGGTESRGFNLRILTVLIILIVAASSFFFIRKKHCETS